MAAKQSYYEMLRSPLWQKKRLEILDRAGFECEDCGSKTDTLNVHHSYYERGVKPWEYPDESLHCLCETCHERAQAAMTNLHRQIGRLQLRQIDELIGYAKALELEEYPHAVHTAENREQLCGMVRLFATLSHHETDWYIDCVLSVTGEGGEADGCTLLDCVEEVKKDMSSRFLPMPITEDCSA
jgi:hypothetical protein